MTNAPAEIIFVAINPKAVDRSAEAAAKQLSEEAHMGHIAIENACVVFEDSEMGHSASDTLVEACSSIDAPIMVGSLALAKYDSGTDNSVQLEQSAVDGMNQANDTLIIVAEQDTVQNLLAYYAYEGFFERGPDDKKLPLVKYIRNSKKDIVNCDYLPETFVTLPTDAEDIPDDTAPPVSFETNKSANTSISVAEQYPMSIYDEYGLFHKTDRWGDSLKRKQAAEAQFLEATESQFASEDVDTTKKQDVLV